MKSIEEMIDAMPDAGEFWKDCQATFGDPGGRRVLMKLCQLAHPLLSPLRSTPEETHVCIGRNEIVAALWRRSQASIQPIDAAPESP